MADSDARMGRATPSATMRKFGAPDSCVHEYARWLVLLRPQQVTLGSLVLIAREPATAFPQLGDEAFSELRKATSDLESALHTAFHYDRINYLMLMMVDPDVHFHVIPRYAGTKSFDGREFVDTGWPGPPRLDMNNPTDAAVNAGVLGKIRQHWP